MQAIILELLKQNREKKKNHNLGQQSPTKILNSGAL